MARSVTDTRLSNRTARLQLAPRGKPYYRELEQGLHLGYRRVRRGAGRWVVRAYIGGEQYRVETIGTADDYSDATGGDPDLARILSYRDAQEAARRAADRIHLDPGASLDGIAKDQSSDSGPYTVAAAIRDYLAAMEHGGQDAKDTRTRARALILPDLGKIEVRKLTAARIRRWHSAMATRAGLVRAGKDGKRKSRAFDASNREHVRRRRSTANRVLTILKAALNHAWHEKRVANRDEWARVKPYRHVEKARKRWLSDDEIGRLVNACPEDFRRIVLGALFTGARYGDLTRLQVGDFDPNLGTVHVLQSKTDEPRNVFLTGEGVDFFASVTAGRATGEHIFVKADGGPWGKSHQRRPMLDACKAAKIEPAVSFYVLRHTYGSRAVNNGVELKVIAENLGHKDTRMVERHYGHMADEYRAKRLREGIPVLGIKFDKTIVPLPAARPQNG